MRQMPVIGANFRQKPLHFGLGSKDFAVQMAGVPADEDIADVEDDGVDHDH